MTSTSRRKEDSWRTILREIRVKRITREARELARRYGYLPYMVQRYIDILGLDEARELLRAFEKPVKPVVRCNDLRVDCRWLVERLNELGFELEPIPWSRYSYRVTRAPGKPSIGATHEYLKGYYYVHRDAAPLIPSILLVDNWVGEVLDGCAAPGGKATHIAQLMRGRGLVVANDLVLYRLRALVGHVMRMGFRNIVATWADLRKLPRLLNKRFKRVLVDTPCSGEGTIMLDPSRKRRTTIRDLSRIVAREIQLLKAGIQLLEPGGRLVYVTCSIAPEENEYVLTKILEEHKDITVKPPPPGIPGSPGVKEYGDKEYNPEVNNCIRTWPHIHGTIGMTICILEKK